MYGLLASIAGSFCGGKLSSMMPIPKAVLVSLVVRLFGAVMQLLFVVTPTWHTPGPAIATMMAEGFCGGLLTTSIFAYMMSIVS